MTYAGARIIGSPRHSLGGSGGLHSIQTIQVSLCYLDETVSI